MQYKCATLIIMSVEVWQYEVNSIHSVQIMYTHIVKTYLVPTPMTTVVTNGHLVPPVSIMREEGWLP